MARRIGGAQRPDRRLILAGLALERGELLPGIAIGELRLVGVALPRAAVGLLVARDDERAALPGGGVVAKNGGSSHVPVASANLHNGRLIDFRRNRSSNLVQRP